MDWEKYNFKEVFSFRIRIALLIVLVALILGFFFSPEMEMEVEEEPDPDQDTVHFYPYEPEKLENITEIPDNDLDDVLDNKASEDDRQIENDLDITQDLPFRNDKVADVRLGEYVFVSYDKDPEPLNLDKVKFEYPESMRMLGIEGKVYLQLLIDKKGNVLNVLQMDSLHPVLDKVAFENAWEVKFAPAMQREKPVMVWYGFPVEFKLE